MEISPQELTRLLHQAYLEAFSAGHEHAQLKISDALPTTREVMSEASNSWKQSITKTRSIPATFGSGAAL